ncbi:MAG: ATP synthase F1 subunit delta [Salinivirgaceae bacterium]|nr:ATP synthase F1 subunit delta [Salinivirgaceae bacterium]
MDNSRIAVRYAKALFDVAVEKDMVAALKTDFALVGSLCADADMKQFLGNPTIKPSKKILLFNNVLAGSVDQLTLNFIKLIVENGRVEQLAAVCRNFAARCNQHLGIKHASVVTVLPVDAELKAKIEKVVADALNVKVELEAKQDPSIIGGFVLQVDDKQIDASVATKLKQLKRQFTDFSI